MQMKTWIRSSLFAVALGGLALTPIADADAATYLKLKGQKSGEIKGSIVTKGFEGTIAVESISHEIVSPRDPQSGLPTGKRQHKPFVITKQIDKSTPILSNMLVNNENITEWTLQVTEPNAKKGDQVSYKVKLTNANIASIKTTTREDGTMIETVAFQAICFC